MKVIRSIEYSYKRKILLISKEEFLFVAGHLIEEISWRQLRCIRITLQKYQQTLSFVSSFGATKSKPESWNNMVIRITIDEIEGEDHSFREDIK